MAIPFSSKSPFSSSLYTELILGRTLSMSMYNRDIILLSQRWSPLADISHTTYLMDVVGPEPTLLRVFTRLSVRTRATSHSPWGYPVDGYIRHLFHCCFDVSEELDLMRSRFGGSRIFIGRSIKLWPREYGQWLCTPGSASTLSLYNSTGLVSPLSLVIPMVLSNFKVSYILLVRLISYT